MVQQRMQALTERLQTVKPEDPLLAQQWNIIVNALREMVDLMQLSSDDHRWADMFVGELEEDASADETGFDVSECRHNEGSGGLTTMDVAWDKTFEPQSGLWLEGERLLFFWDRVSARYCMVPIVQVHFGKLDGQLVAEGSATMSVWEVDPDTGDWVDSGNNITVYDWCLKSGSAIAAGKKVIVAQLLQSRRFVVITAECP